MGVIGVILLVAFVIVCILVVCLVLVHLNYKFIVNNYYDSIYARYNNLDENKVLPEYNEQELVKFKYKSYKKIMNSVGSLGIQNEFKKSRSYLRCKRA